MGNPAGLCQTCRWYGAERADTGSCRLNAPVIFSQSGTPQQTNQLAWPEVRIDDWCSEFSDQGTTWTPPSGGAGSVAGVSSFNTRTGAVSLSTADVTGAGGAPIASPTFTGTPTLPTGTIGVTQTAGNNSTALATTAFVATTVGAYLPLAGGTLTGALIIAPASGAGLTINGAVSQININKPAGANANNLIGQTATSPRWNVQLGNSASESGSNAGSDFTINRYSDAGAAIDAPLTITRSTGQVAIKGTNTNDSAAAGFVGEYISSVVNAPGITLTTGVFANVTSISLTAGDWDVSGEVWVAVGTGGATAIAVAISTTSAAMPGNPAQGAARTQMYLTFTASVAQIVPLASTRFSLAATTTVYLVVYCTFASGTTTAYGRIGARRIR